MCNTSILQANTVLNNYNLMKLLLVIVGKTCNVRYFLKMIRGSKLGPNVTTYLKIAFINLIAEKAY